MKDYKDWMLDCDNGGVHVNSGIPNHAFYLAAVATSGYAWEKVGKIWYLAFTRKLSANADFEAAAQATLEVAAAEYSAGSKEYQAVQEAWKQAGVI